MTDVAVFGATATGVIAAVAASEAGASTVLVEPGAHVGGMVSGGLSWTDVGDTRALGGLTRRFYEAVATHYDAPLWSVKGPAPHVAETIMIRMLERAAVDVRLRACRLPDAAVAVDASYEGDLLAERGVPYAVGRESRELYGFRVCLTDRPENRLPLPAPDGYDPAAYELLRRYLAAASGLEARDLLGLVPDLLPGGKCDVNSIGPFSLNLLDGSNRGYPDGTREERERIGQRHLEYTQALLHFLANDDAVPSHIRGEVARWGLCADEFVDTGGWPHYLSIAVPPYAIPYRSLTPRREDCGDLLVPLCLSASHIAFASVRMEPTLMALGHAAGAAAAQAARRGVAVQDVDVRDLQLSLLEQGQVLAA